MSFDVLQNKIKAKKNPTVAGLDARVEYVPPFILKKHTDRLGETLEAAAAAVLEFDKGLIDALADVVPAVKPQSAYFEMLGWRGMKALEEIIAYAKSKDLFVIADIKRGDIGTTAAAYSEAWLGATQVAGTACPVFDADCVTLNGYMGSDAIKPFLKDCSGRDKCAFVLAKTSNPSSMELQDIVAGDRLVYTVMGDLIQRWGQGTHGKCGYQALGAVVGATHPAVLKELRRRLDRVFFLVPGYGAQGAPPPTYATRSTSWGAEPSSTPPVPSCVHGRKPARTAQTIRKLPGPLRRTCGTRSGSTSRSCESSFS